MTEDEEVYAFYYELGVALTQWSSVEFALERIVMQCAAPNHEAGVLLAIGFRSIANWRSRAEYADRLVSHSYSGNPEILNAWKHALKSAQSVATLRNEIAHREPSRMGGAKPGERIALLEGGWALQKPRPNGFSRDELITIKDVVERGQKFSLVSFELVKLLVLISGSGVQLPASLAPQVHRPTMGQIEARMRAALGRQQRPSPKKSQSTSPE